MNWQAFRLPCFAGENVEQESDSDDEFENDALQDDGYKDGADENELEKKGNSLV